MPMPCFHAKCGPNTTMLIHPLYHNLYELILHFTHSAQVLECARSILYSSQHVLEWSQHPARGYDGGNIRCCHLANGRSLVLSMWERISWVVCLEVCRRLLIKWIILSTKNTQHGLYQEMSESDLGVYLFGAKAPWNYPTGHKELKVTGRGNSLQLNTSTHATISTGRLPVCTGKEWIE